MLKKTRKSPSKPSVNGMPPRYQAERKRMRKEIEDLKAERDQYKKSLIALMWEDTPRINKKEILAMTRGQPTLKELIAELEAGGG